HLHPRALHSFPTRRSPISRLTRDAAGEKFLGRGEGQGVHSHRPHQSANRLASLFIVVYDEDGRFVGHGCRLLKIALSRPGGGGIDRKSTRLNSSHVKISYA